MWASQQESSARASQMELTGTDNSCAAECWPAALQVDDGETQSETSEGFSAESRWDSASSLPNDACWDVSSTLSGNKQAESLRSNLADLTSVENIDDAFKTNMKLLSYSDTGCIAAPAKMWTPEKLGYLKQSQAFDSSSLVRSGSSPTDITIGRTYRSSMDFGAAISRNSGEFSQSPSKAAPGRATKVGAEDLQSLLDNLSLGPLSTDSANMRPNASLALSSGSQLLQGSSFGALSTIPAIHAPAYDAAEVSDSDSVDGPCRHVWVGNLLPHLPRAVLQTVFSVFGPIDDVITFPGRMYGFVNFKHTEDAATACRMLNNKEVPALTGGRALVTELRSSKKALGKTLDADGYAVSVSPGSSVSCSTPRSGSDNGLDRGLGSGDWEGSHVPSTRVWVGNIAAGATVENVRAVFQQFGQLVDAAVFPSRIGPLGFAFVNFEDVAHAKNAYNLLNNNVVPQLSGSKQLKMRFKPSKDAASGFSDNNSDYDQQSYCAATSEPMGTSQAISLPDFCSQLGNFGVASSQDAGEEEHANRAAIISGAVPEASAPIEASAGLDSAMFPGKPADCSFPSLDAGGLAALGGLPLEVDDLARTEGELPLPAVNLSNRLNPNNVHFDRDLASAYRRMTKAEKEDLWAQDRLQQHHQRLAMLAEQQVLGLPGTAPGPDGLPDLASLLRTQAPAHGAVFSQRTPQPHLLQSARLNPFQKPARFAGAAASDPRLLSLQSKLSAYARFGGAPAPAGVFGRTAQFGSPVDVNSYMGLNDAAQQGPDMEAALRHQLHVIQLQQAVQQQQQARAPYGDLLGALLAQQARQAQEAQQQQQLEQAYMRQLGSMQQQPEPGYNFAGNENVNGVYGDMQQGMLGPNVMPRASAVSGMSDAASGSWLGYNARAQPNHLSAIYEGRDDLQLGGW